MNEAGTSVTDLELESFRQQWKLELEHGKSSAQATVRSSSTADDFKVPDTSLVADAQRRDATETTPKKLDTSATSVDHVVPSQVQVQVQVHGTTSKSEAALHAYKAASLLERQGNLGEALVKVF
ncbi:hypothetical protein HDU96_000276 [Phlyctochytrium bullatum]|nr:hypothetical protein HDU96_000276 [Phlyctochytrium bullatum]